MATDAESIVRQLLVHVGEDPSREGLLDTPSRVLKAWSFWCSGYDCDVKSLLKTFKDGSENYDELVFVGSIPFFSQCEHHLAPFFGVAHVGYLPNGRIVGLSKIPRLVEAFARRLQVQERLTQQIAFALSEHLSPRAVGVVIRARHMCMESRGVQKVGSVTMTSSLLGAFKDDMAARAEFFGFVERADGKASF